jgi:anaerobic ribonucleoside-triphosphate reductase
LKTKTSIDVLGIRSLVINCPGIKKLYKQNKKRRNIEMVIKKIRKRDGSVVPFDEDKITQAIWKAAKAVGGHDKEKAEIISKQINDLLDKKFGESAIPDVEEVQDLVEKVLIEGGYAKTAKAYILYRKSHDELRKVKGLFDTIEVVDDYLSLSDWMVKENSNMGFSLQGLNNYIATKIITNYWNRRVYPEAIRAAHESADIHIHDLGTLGAYCFDEETKILTENGWKFFKEVKENERVATKNLKTGKMEFQIPYAKQIYNYNGEMYSFEGRNVSLLVTPEHRLLVRKKDKKEWIFVNPPEFKYGMEFDKKISWEGSSPRKIVIPEIKGGNRKKPKLSFDISDYIEFMGWYISEGSVYEPSKGDYRISIAQSEGKYREEIRKLIHKMKLNFNDSSKENIHIHSKDLYYHLKDIGISKDKYIPKEIKTLEPRLIKKFLTALFRGDGSFSKGNFYKYYSNSKKLCEDVVECLLKIGVCGTVTKRKNSNTYMVSVENKQLTPIYRGKVIKKKYSGKVYDFSVPNSTLVVMREGKVVVSGNCVGWDLKDLIITGFTGVSGKVSSSPPKHLRTALGQMVNFFYTLQGETAGAQAFSNFDTLLAPFVRYDNLGYREVKQAMQEFLFNLAVPTRVGFQCMSEDTKILTPNGWKGHNELSKGDIIKTFNIKNGKIEDKPINNLFARHYEGEMYNLKNRIQNQLISPKHRIVRKKFSGGYVLEEVEKVDKMKSPFIIPVAGENVTPDINLSDEKIKLMAWVIAEGTIENYNSHRHSSRITIYQSAIKNPQKYQEISGLLNGSGLMYAERDSTPAYGSSVKMMRLNADSSKEIHLMFETNKSVKHIPQKLLNMSERQSRLFLETYIKADGFEESKIATTNKNILNGLQQIAVNAGYGFTVLKRNPTIGTKMIYVLRLIKHKETYIQEIKKVDYSGIIWCPNTENETVIAKRKGKVFITGNTPFTNITMDLKVPSYMADEPVIIGGNPMKETYKEFQMEMDMINKAFADCMLAGDAQGRVFTFPIPTYNITKDFDWDNENLDLIWKMTAKYGIPYFSNFINSDMNPEDARSMCCRLRLDQKELRKRGGGLFGANPQTGSVGVVTINMPRLGFTCVNENDFFDKLSNLMELSKESLEIKRKTLERYTDMGLYPYSKFYLRHVKQRFGQYWKNHFSTIGLLGMNECIMNFMEGENITTERGKAFAIKVLKFMRERLEEYQIETNNIYNLEATPGEGTSYRFARDDKKRYGRIICANEISYKNGAKPYYTNSTQLPVNYTDDLFDALDAQDELQIQYTGGTVLHGFIGERMTEEGVKKVVKKIAENYHLPYFTITPTFSICPIHGYLSGEHEYCPRCDEEQGIDNKTGEQIQNQQIRVGEIK